MSLSEHKIAAFTKKVSDLADKPNEAGMTAALVKSQFDSSPEELRVALNGVIDKLMAVVTGASGAHHVGSAVIDGVTGATVFEQLLSLKTQLNGLALGSIPDKSLTYEKLDTSNQTAASSATIYAYKNLGGL